MDGSGGVDDAGLDAGLAGLNHLAGHSGGVMMDSIAIDHEDETEAEGRPMSFLPGF